MLSDLLLNSNNEITNDFYYPDPTQDLVGRLNYVRITKGIARS